MKIEIKNSSVEFKRFDSVLFDEDVSFTTNEWKYLNLAFTVPYKGKVKTTLTIDSSVVSSISTAQVLSYYDGTVTDHMILLYKKYNESVIATNYQSAFSQVGLYLNGSGVFPLTVHLKIEFVEIEE